MILLGINTLRKSLKITAIVTVLSLPLPLDWAQKPRDTFGRPWLQESMENSDVFLRNQYWETHIIILHPEILSETAQGLDKQLGSPSQLDTGTSFLLVLKSFPIFLQMKELTGLFPETLKKPTNCKNSIL